MRTVSPGGLTNIINNYNNTVAGNLTPAGAVLVNAGLFTPAQMGVGNPNCANNLAFPGSGINNGALCAVAPAIPVPPQGEVGLTWLKTFDMSLSWIGSVNFHDKPISFEPSVSFYNLFNFANYNIPGNVLSGILTGTPGSVNGTTYPNASVVRVGVGTGVFALGAPRTIEFGMKMSF